VPANRFFVSQAKRVGNQSRDGEAVFLDIDVLRAVYGVFLRIVCRGQFLATVSVISAIALTFAYIMCRGAQKEKGCFSQPPLQSVLDVDDFYDFRQFLLEQAFDAHF